MAREQFARLSIITLAALGRRIDGSGPINQAVENNRLRKPPMKPKHIQQLTGIDNIPGVFYVPQDRDGWRKLVVDRTVVECPKPVTIL